MTSDRKPFQQISVVRAREEKMMQYMRMRTRKFGFYQMIAWGLVLLLAVVIDQLRRSEA